MIYSATTIDWINELGAEWSAFATILLLESAILFVLIGILDLLWLRRGRTAVRLAAWSLLLWRLVLPIMAPIPLSIMGMDERAWGQVASRLDPAAVRYAIGGLFLPAADSTELPHDILDVTVPNETLTAIDLSPQSPSSSLLPGHENLVVSTQVWLWAGWGVIVLIMGLLFILRLRQVHRLLRESVPAHEALCKLFGDVQQTLRLGPNRVRLRISREIMSPAICGLWHTTILIPESVVNVFSTAQVRMILAHELVHWRRRDLLWNLLQTLLQIVYFYNPLVWITNSLLRCLREQNVDEEVVVATGIAPEEYAATLVDVAAVARLHGRTLKLSLGVMQTHSSLALRVRRLLTRRLPSHTRLGWRGGLAMIALATLLLQVAGCYRLVGTISDPNLDALDEFSLEQDPRSMEAMRDSLEMVADKMVQREALPELKLSESGVAEQRLAAAGVVQVAPNELVGLVVDADLKPVAGAKVDAYYWHPDDTTVTDHQGVFRLPDLDPDEAPPLYITKNGYSPRIVTDRPTGRKNLIVILNNQTCIRGVVHDADNKPVKGARVIAACGRISYPDHQREPKPFETVTGDDGRYRLDVFSNKYDVKVFAAGTGAHRQTGVIVAPGQSVEHDVRLEQGHRFEAIVVDSVSGKPFEGLTLYSTSAPRVRGRSDSQGRIVLENQFSGIIEFRCGAGEQLGTGENEYWAPGSLGRWWSPDAIHPHERKYRQPQYGKSGRSIMVWQENDRSLTFEIGPDMKPVEIIVEAGATVTGTITDPAGQAVRGAIVVPVLSGVGRWLAVRRAITDEQGHYQLILPATHDAQYNMVAQEGGEPEKRRWASGISRILQTSPGEVLSGVDVTLTVPGTVRGRVMSGGKPVARRTILACNVDGRERLGPMTETAADGTFELQQIRTGKVFIHAAPIYWPPDSDPKGFRLIELQPGQVLENIELDLKESK